MQYSEGMALYMCQNSSARAQISLSYKLFPVTHADFNCCAQYFVLRTHIQQQRETGAGASE